MGQTHSTMACQAMVRLKRLCVVALLAVVGACSEPLPVYHHSDQAETPAADGILIKFTHSTGTSSRARSVQAAGLTERSRFSLVPGLTLASVQPGYTLNETLSELAKDPTVAFAEPNYIYSINVLPNDPRFARQYGLHNTGQNGGVADADIDAPEAWDIQTGNDVVVAVIDTGVDYNHPDLVNNIWTNPGEIPGNNRDDDGNGFVDDVRGWDFALNNNNPMDNHNHGTHVAGIIAARGNNGIGVAGVNWRARIMPLKFMDNQGIGTTASAIRAIEYAVANGAKVSNNSWGGTNFSQALYDAIQAANSAGHVFVAAAGNDGVNSDTSGYYPSTYNLPNIISVGASDQNDQITTFSNFGTRTVDLVAPGMGIVSTVIRTNNNGYQFMTGTSMSAPYVTGAISLLYSQNPTLSIAQVRSAILNTVDTKPALSNVVGSGGRLNVFNAVNSVPQSGPIPINPVPAPTPNPAPVNPSVVRVSPQNAEVPIGGSFRFTVSGGQAPYTWSVGNSIVGTIDALSGQFQGLAVGSTSITATDSSGSTSAPVNVTVTNLLIRPVNKTSLQLTEVATFTVNGGVGPYNWSTSNTGVAEISITGAQNETVTVTPAAQGSFSLTASDASGNSVANRLTVVVSPMALDPVTSSIRVGGSLQLNVSGGTSPYSWTSSNTSVATVDGGGIVTGIAAGSVTITATDALGTPQSAQITVAANTTPLVINSPANTVNVGATLQFSASGGVRPYSWGVGNVALASINGTGLLTANAAGTVAVIVTDFIGSVSRQTITINAAPPATVHH
ncbi:MAG: S8 family serine peptidase [Gammaproteobacteria bacterium]|nr:S8 family serine peptidase [Gammaproteobacteria bacterium]